MGIRGGHAFEVSLDGVRVPAANRLGAEGQGFKIAMKVLDNSRLDVAATSLGIAEAALMAAVDWANQRLVGGEPIATKQAIQFKLAEMKLRLEAAWGLTMQALALRQAGQPFTQQSAMAKLYASEMVGFVTDEALQIHGGYGYTREMPLERYVRDARILRIYEALPRSSAPSSRARFFRGVSANFCHDADTGVFAGVIAAWTNTPPCRCTEKSSPRSSRTFSAAAGRRVSASPRRWS